MSIKQLSNIECNHDHCNSSLWHLFALYLMCVTHKHGLLFVPLSCVGLLTICVKPCNLNIVQQHIFDVIDTSSMNSPTIHVGTCWNCAAISNIWFIKTSIGVGWWPVKWYNNHLNWFTYLYNNNFQNCVHSDLFGI